MFRLTAVTENWMSKCKRNDLRFATIKTVSAIYDRTAIVQESANQLVVEYVKKDKNKYTIQTDKISRRSIIEIRYFQD